MMKKAISTVTFTTLFSLALFAGEGCCKTCKGDKHDADCKTKAELRECVAKNCNGKSCKGHHASKGKNRRSTNTKLNNNNNGGEEVITTQEEILIIGEAVPANTAKTPTQAATK